MTTPSERNGAIPLSTSTPTSTSASTTSPNTMSGNFDFPPASDASTSLRNLTARFEGLRETLAEALALEEENRQSSPSLYAHTITTSSNNPLPQTVPNSLQTSGQHRRQSSGRRFRRTLLTPARARARPSQQPVERPIIVRRPREDMPRTSVVSRDESRQQREQSQLVDPHSYGIESTVSVASRSNDNSTDAEGGGLFAPDLLAAHRRLNKRRKLEHDSNLGFPGFAYGHYGQVEPGLLKMEIVGCDGGEYAPRDANAIYRENYRAENVLRNDKTVYCTKSPRCNLMLRHQGESLFHLDSIVIKAPELGYTAPLQQGLVFVGMASDRLSAGTSTYHIQYDPPPPPRERPRERSTPPSETSHDRERMPLLDALYDPSIWEASSQRSDVLPLSRPSMSTARTPRRRATRSNLRASPRAEDEPSASQTYPDNCDWPLIESTSTELQTAPTPPPFVVTWDSEDDGEAEYASERYLPLPTGRDIPSADEETHDSLARLYYLNNVGAAQRPARRSSPGRIALRGRQEVEQVTQPHARFFIGKNRNKITIRFDPPVSGRFLLLKLFSPELHDGENIDIQYVAAYGYAGPRFFPAVEMK